MLKKRSLGLYLCVSIALTGSTVCTAVCATTSLQHVGKLFHGKISYELSLADKLLSQHKFEEASKIFEEQLRRDPHNADAQAGLGMCLAREFKLEAADEQFDRVLASQPQNAIAHAGKALVQLNRLQSSSQAIISRRAGILTDAESEAKLAVDADAQLPEAHYVLGRVFEEQGQLAPAYEEYKQATNLDPDFSAAFAGMGSIDSRSGKRDEAIREFEKAISLNSGNSTAHYGLGEALLSEGQFEQAIKELNISLYQFRNSAPVHLALGKAYEAQGNTDAALKQYEQAVLIKPELKDAYAHMASLHIALGKQCEQQGNVVGAFKEYKQALLIDPQNSEPYLRMADLRERRGDLELALSEMRSGLDLSPNDAQLQERIAETLLKLGKIDDSIQAFQQSLKLQPGNKTAINGLARALYLQAQRQSQDAFLLSNDYESAQSALKQAIKLHPNDLQLRLAQAKLRALSGEPIDLHVLGNPQNDADRISYAEALLADDRFADAAEQLKDVIAHSKNVDQLLAVADLSLSIRDLDSAESAYHKAALAGAADRAKRGLAAVSRARTQAQRDTTLGLDLARKNQLASAVDSLRQAISENPRLPQARLGLASAEEKLAPKSSKDLQDAARQYKAYLALSPELPPNVRRKFEQKVTKIETKAQRIETANVKRQQGK